MTVSRNYDSYTRLPPTYLTIQNQNCDIEKSQFFAVVLIRDWIENNYCIRIEEVRACLAERTEEEPV